VAVPSVPAVVITPAAGRLVLPSLVGVRVDALRSLVA
jgi:hypothetical protein